MSRPTQLLLLAAVVAVVGGCTMTRSEFEAIKEGVREAGRQQPQQQQQTYRRPSDVSARGVR
jgi:hypothetical protein